MLISGLFSLVVGISTTTGGINTPSISTTVKPVAGSKRLESTFDIVAGSASDFIVHSIKDLERIVEGMDQTKGKAKKERESRLRALVSNMLDLNRLGQRALVTHWETLGKSKSGINQRDQYVGLFRDLVEENYMEQARKYIGGNYVLTLTSEEKSEGAGTLVYGRIKKPDVDVIVEFNMIQNGNQWKVTDIKLDATSLEATYRSSFNRIIRKKGGLEAGFPELIKTMKKRLAELKSGKSTSL